MHFMKAGTQTLIEASMRGDLEKVKALLAAGADKVAMDDVGDD